MAELTETVNEIHIYWQMPEEKIQDLTNRINKLLKEREADPLDYRVQFINNLLLVTFTTCEVRKIKGGKPVGY